MPRLQEAAESLGCSITRSGVPKDLDISTKTSDIGSPLWWVAQRFRAGSSDNSSTSGRQKKRLIEDDYSSNQLYRVLASLTNSSMMKFQKATKIESDTNDDRNQVKSIRTRVRQLEICDKKTDCKIQKQ